MDPRNRAILAAVAMVCLTALVITVLLVRDTKDPAPDRDPCAAGLCRP